MSVATLPPRSSRNELTVQRAVVAALATATAGFALLEVHSFVRTLVTFAFLLVCPGLGLANMTRISDRGAILVTAVAMSIAINTLVAEAMAYANAWSPDAALGLLILIALFAWPRTRKRTRQ